MLLLCLFTCTCPILFVCIYGRLNIYSLMQFFYSQGNKTEKLVSGSDDFTLFLWEPEENKKPIARMTGISANMHSLNIV